MKLWDAIHNGFLDTAALVSPNKNGGSLNGVMYTGEAIVIADRIGELDQQWKAYWIEVMKPCELSPGVLMRKPDDTRDEEAPDDYYGFLAGAKRCDPSRARAFLWHGVKHLGFYNTDGKFAWSDCLWRQPQLITHAMWAAGLWTGPARLFFIFSLMVAVWQNTPPSNTDARRIGWLLIQNWDRKGWLCKYAVNRWTAWMLSGYSHGMRDCAWLYYGAGHPFITAIPIF